MKTRVVEAPIPERVDEFPLSVAGEEYDELVERAKRTAMVIDRHLDHEKKHQGREMSPSILCLEQKGQFASDILNI